MNCRWKFSIAVQSYSIMIWSLISSSVTSETPWGNLQCKCQRTQSKTIELVGQIKNKLSSINFAAFSKTRSGEQRNAFHTLQNGFSPIPGKDYFSMAKNNRIKSERVILIRETYLQFKLLSHSKNCCNGLFRKASKSHQNLIETF